MINVGAEALDGVGASWATLYETHRLDYAEWTPPVGLACLRRWPDLREIPDDHMLTVVRISALLWHKPTHTHLVHRSLGAHASETHRVLRLLEASGCVEFISTMGHGTASSEAMARETEAPPIRQERSALHSFIEKLRFRLLG